MDSSAHGNVSGHSVVTVEMNTGGGRISGSHDDSSTAHADVTSLSTVAELAGGAAWVHDARGVHPRPTERVSDPLSAPRHASSSTSIEQHGPGSTLDGHTHDGHGTHVDVFRDTWVRYLGYTNEFGESFRAFIPKSVYLGSYAVASAYCVADSAAKGMATSDAGGSPIDVADVAAEALVWQGFASVVFPGLVINRVVSGYASMASRLLTTLPRFFKLVPPRVGAVAAGLAAIPLIINPIDRVVDSGMEVAYRPLADALLRGRTNVESEVSERTCRL